MEQQASDPSSCPEVQKMHITISRIEEKHVSTYKEVNIKARKWLIIRGKVLDQGGGINRVGGACVDRNVKIGNKKLFGNQMSICCRVADTNALPPHGAQLKPAVAMMMMTI